MAIGELEYFDGARFPAGNSPMWDVRLEIANGYISGFGFDSKTACVVPTKLQGLCW